MYFSISAEMSQFVELQTHQQPQTQDVDNVCLKSDLANLSTTAILVQIIGVTACIGVSIESMYIHAKIVHHVVISDVQTSSTDAMSLSTP